MKRKFFSLIAIASVVAGAYLLFLKEPTFKAKNGYLNNINPKNVIIEGYDAISYFTDKKPVKGLEKFSVEFAALRIGSRHLNMLSRLKKTRRNTLRNTGLFAGMP